MEGGEGGSTDSPHIEINYDVYGKNGNTVGDLDTFYSGTLVYYSSGEGGGVLPLSRT